MTLSRRTLFRFAASIAVGSVVMSGCAQTDMEIKAPLSEQSIEIEMRDGVILRGRFLQSSAGRGPVLVIRTPYGLDNTQWMIPPDILPISAVSNAGFSILLLDVRGTGTSDGTFEPLRYEIDDGEDTLKWVKAQPWSDGQIYAAGASYLGFTGFAMAVGDSSPAQGIIYVNTAADAYNGWYYSNGGVFSLENTDRYALFNAGIAAMASGDTQTGELLMNMPKTQARLLAGTAPTIDLTRDGASWFEDIASHPFRDEYWETLSFSDRFENVSAAGLHIGGWFDFFATSTVSDFLALKSKARTQFARENQYLIMGPWTHNSQTGEYDFHDFGPNAGAAAAGVKDRALTFLENNGSWPARAHVMYFDMGVNQWRSADTWPPAGTQNVSLYLSPEFQLSEASVEAGIMSLPFDLSSPVPTHGGRLLTIGDTWTDAGPRDQRDVESRSDVLSFDTPVFETDTPVAGNLTLEAFISTTHADADLSVIITDVAPDGTSRYLCDGIGRLSLRNGTKEKAEIESGEVYRLDVSAGVTANTIQAGHKLRVDLAASNFPNFELNPHLVAAGVSTGNHQIHLGEATPTRLIVPMIGG